MSAPYTLTSIKGEKQIDGDLAAAIRAAIEMEEDLQPAFGVGIVRLFDGAAFECRNGRVAVYADASEDSEDSEDGVASLVNGELMIAWEQGNRTQFADTGLQPG